MSTTGLNHLDRAMHVANTWLSELMKALDIDRHTAWQVLAAVLHTLRDRLTNEQVAHLGGQLPLIIRGLFFDQWHTSPDLSKLRTQQAFLAHVSKRLKSKRRVDSKQAVETVFSVLAHHPKGEIEKIIKTLPPAIKSLAISGTAQFADPSAFAWE
jgi:uncharacterized protein (DUF2267 family)